MTTDTKAVARFFWSEDEMDEDRSGDYVLFADHERLVGEFSAERLRWFERAGEYLKRAQAAEDALAASRAEVEGLLDVIADAAAALDRLGDRKMASALMARWDAAMENGND